MAAKAKLSSIEVEGIRDGDRADLTLVDTLPRGTKVKQVSFTQDRMFVLTQRGELYMYMIKQHFPSRDDISLFGSGAQPKIRGELMTNE